ncbi:MAG: Dodecaprenyl-phosphate galacturonate synthase [Calditrichaeota bacterium]|nr:Dodecaprenyl-phosphate galacturonate synthase [Calditrichota bacterium]
MGTATLDLSLVIPVKDERRSIAPLAREIDAAFADSRRRWEVIWVDDGSTDGTFAELKALRDRDARHRYISFRRNAGQAAALLAGFRAARGDLVGMMDGDGQNDPADLPRLLEALPRSGAEMVNGYRRVRRDSALRRFASRVANGVRGRFLGDGIRDVGCSLRVMRRDCLAELPAVHGMHRFLPALASMRGFRTVQIPVNHRPRRHGRTKYGIGNRLWVGIADMLWVKWYQLRHVRPLIGDRSD